MVLVWIEGESNRSWRSSVVVVVLVVSAAVVVVIVVDVVVFSGSKFVIPVGAEKEEEGKKLLDDLWSLVSSRLVTVRTLGSSLDVALMMCAPVSLALFVIVGLAAGAVSIGECMGGACGAGGPAAVDRIGQVGDEDEEGGEEAPE